MQVMLAQRSSGVRVTVHDPAKKKMTIESIRAKNSTAK
jgi:hypothetical protein